MAEYIPSPRQWVREQVELYERSGGTEGTTRRDTGLPVVIVTNIGNKPGAIRKAPRMRVREVTDNSERARLWKLAVAAYQPYQEYQAKTTRQIPLFVAEPTR